MGQKLAKYLEIEESTWPSASEWNLQLQQMKSRIFLHYLYSLLSVLADKNNPLFIFFSK